MRFNRFVEIITLKLTPTLKYRSLFGLTVYFVGNRFKTIQKHINITFVIVDGRV